MKSIFLLLLFVLVSCSTLMDKTADVPNENEMLDQAEREATPSARKVLEVSRTMIADQDVIVGGCWNYVNAVFDRAGFKSKERTTVFKSKFVGPYADVKDIKTGDWLYFVNHSYSDIEHSAIFVAWVNIERKEALMVNYVGGNKKKPATYKRFILDNVYMIIRA